MEGVRARVSWLAVNRTCIGFGPQKVLTESFWFNLPKTRLVPWLCRPFLGWFCNSRKPFLEGFLGVVLGLPNHFCADFGCCFAAPKPFWCLFWGFLKPFLAPTPFLGLLLVAVLRLFQTISGTVLGGLLGALSHFCDCFWELVWALFWGSQTISGTAFGGLSQTISGTSFGGCFGAFPNHFWDWFWAVLGLPGSFLGSLGTVLDAPRPFVVCLGPVLPNHFGAVYFWAARCLAAFGRAGIWKHNQVV